MMEPTCMSENKKKIIFIVNPISGTQSKELVLSLLDEKIDKEMYTWEIVYTERAGHAIEIAADAADKNTDIVVAVGGDGTINEIARSLVHTNTALGIIPCGSGNGLARHLQISMDPRKALEILNDGIIDIIDYGKINGTDFFCTCGVGFDAFVSLKFANAGKRGLLTYLEKTLQESLKYQHPMSVASRASFCSGTFSRPRNVLNSYSPSRYSGLRCDSSGRNVTFRSSYQTACGISMLIPLAYWSCAMR